MARIIGRGYSYNDVLIIPKYNKVRSRRDVQLKTKVTRNHYIDIPFIASNMDTVCESKMAITLGKLGGLGIIHRFMPIEEEAKEVRKVKEQGLLTAAAVGIKDTGPRAEALVKAGVDILLIDLAHGHSKYAGKTLDYLKQLFPQIDIMVGNISTKDAAEYYLSKGADAIKVGVGPGTMCKTRIMTGAGIPQLTAIMDVYEAVKNEIPICADGGIKVPGDVTKALGAGASTIMSGTIFAGTEESPGEIIEKEGKKYKLYRGSASFDASMKKAELDGEKEKGVISVEGEETFILYKGPIKEYLEPFLGGLRSGMTYMGTDNMKKLIGKADFIEISSAGFEESTANGVSKKT